MFAIKQLLFSERSIRVYLLDLQSVVDAFMCIPTFPLHNTHPRYILHKDRDAIINSLRTIILHYMIML